MKIAHLLCAIGLWAPLVLDAGAAESPARAGSSAEAMRMAQAAKSTAATAAPRRSSSPAPRSNADRLRSLHGRLLLRRLELLLNVLLELLGVARLLRFARGTGGAADGGVRQAAACQNGAHAEGAQVGPQAPRGVRGCLHAMQPKSAVRAVPPSARQFHRCLLASQQIAQPKPQHGEHQQRPL